MRLSPRGLPSLVPRVRLRRGVGWARIAFACTILAAALTACAEEWPSHIDLAPAGANVEIAVEPPSKDGYILAGQITGIAAANDLEAATEAARNDLRNKAAALGATLVTIDENTGEALLLQDKTKVKLTGRAYKSVE
jgi:hypothetical protein